MKPLRYLSAWICALSGLAILVLAARAGWLAVAVAWVPAALIVAGGVRSLLVPDMRAPQQVATGAVLGAVLALPWIVVAASIAREAAAFGLALLLLSAAALVAGGWFQLRCQPVLDEVPAPPPTLGYAAMVAADDFLLGQMSSLSPMPSGSELAEAAAESRDARALFAARGWLDDPASFHRLPPRLHTPELAPLQVAGLACERLTFDSGFAPDPAIPGAARWQSYAANRTAHATILRRREPAPWLVCIHGAGMGANVKQDFGTFGVAERHRRFGLNVALFVLPVHGPRSPGGFGGAKFFGHSVLDVVHAEAHAIWDLRRLIGWIRGQGATSVGVWGISLGGYTSALLAGIEDDLACVIAQVPPADLIATNLHLASTLMLRRSAAAGVDVARDREVHRVISPLALPPKAPHERRFIAASTGDQFVPIEQVRALWRHWQRPRIAWNRGGHISGLLQAGPRRFIDQALSEAFAG